VDFAPLPARVQAKQNCPLALTWLGFSFVISEETHVWTCEPWPYGTGPVHGQIYDRRTVPGSQELGDVYYSEVSAMLFRVSDNLTIPVKSISFSIDCDSWTWAFSAEVLGKEALEAVKPLTDPVEVEAVINGHRFRAIVEKWNDQYSFNQKTYTIKGRSPCALLDKPYVEPTLLNLTSDSSAKQVVENILNPQGYSLDWNTSLVPDWIIKAEALSVRETPIRQVLHILSALDVILNVDKADLVFHVRPRHKHKSWTWAGQTPDSVLQESFCYSLSGEFIPGRDIDCVYVQGDSAGAVGAKVIISGEAGNKPLPEITHPLLTDTQACLFRGTQALSYAKIPMRKNTLVTVLNPPDTNPNLFLPGDFIEFFIEGVSHKGAVASTSITAAWDDRGLKVIQTLEVFSIVR